MFPEPTDTGGLPRGFAAPLTEADTKAVAMGFLRIYYSRRPRESITSATLTSFDVRGDGGLIIDGLLRFNKSGGKLFLATFEATSREKMEEVTYRQRTPLLLVDSLSLGVFAVGMAFLLSHLLKFYLLPRYGYSGTAGLLVVACGAAAVLYYALFHSLARYRYIYAIEQFKQFHADEQWVAFAINTFTGSDFNSRETRLGRRYLQELKKQCIRYGIGLLEVEDRQTARIIYSPSRADLLQGSGRRTLREISLNKWREQMPLERIKSQRQALQERVRRLTERANERIPLLERPRQWFHVAGTTIQSGGLWLTKRVWLPLLYLLGLKSREYLPGYGKLSWRMPIFGAIGVFLMIVLIFRQETKLPEALPDTQVYANRMRRAADTLIPEERQVVISRDDLPYLAPVDSLDGDSLPLPPEERFDQLIVADERGGRGKVTFQQQDEIYQVERRPNQRPVYTWDCGGFSLLDTTVYLIHDSIFADLTTAERRLAELSDRGVTATATAGSCLRPGLNGQYYVSINGIFTDSTTAVAELRLVAQRLRNMGSRPRIEEFRIGQ